jgi:hypothetical protein
VDVAIGAGRVVVIVAGDGRPGDGGRTRLGERIAADLAAAMDGTIDPVSIRDARGYRVMLPLCEAEPPASNGADGAGGGR